LRKTAFAVATAGSIRFGLIKIGALITTQRRVKVAMSAGHLGREELIVAFRALSAAVRA
jgi:hypothetical protein